MLFVIFSEKKTFPVIRKMPFYISIRKSRFGSGPSPIMYKMTSFLFTVTNSLK